jgi:predicted metal-dependent phosphoesterase TrpH
MKFDLHCHSTASDGTLAPAELVRRAHANGVDVLALTDHDGTDGLAEAAAEAANLPLRLLPGVEISVTWCAKTIHIVGLGIDPGELTLAAGLAGVRDSRLDRGKLIALELARLGIEGSFEAALAYARNPQTLSRTHFARFLVEKGYARDVKAVFHRYLGEGKPGYVPHQWASLSDAVAWINAGGGAAVIAHPGRYGLSRERAEVLLREFRDCGGKGVEVLTASHTAEQSRLYAELSRKMGLAASCGSDFHSPGESRVDLGALPPLPSELQPIWELLAV